jgi:hypothetical protein
VDEATGPGNAILPLHILLVLVLELVLESEAAEVAECTCHTE